MGKVEAIKNEMIQAMKDKNKPKKDTLALLLSALKNAQIDKMGILSEAEEDAVVQKEIKQDVYKRQVCDCWYRVAIKHTKIM